MKVRVQWGQGLGRLKSLKVRVQWDQGLGRLKSVKVTVQWGQGLGRLKSLKVRVQWGQGLVCLLCYIPVFQYYTNTFMISLYCIITLDIVDINLILWSYMFKMFTNYTEIYWFNYNRTMFSSIDHKINSYWKTKLIHIEK